MSERICAKCKHVSHWAHDRYECTRTARIDVVTGRPHYRDCRVERGPLSSAELANAIAEGVRRCGPEGVHFEPKT